MEYCVLDRGGEAGRSGEPGISFVLLARRAERLDLRDRAEQGNPGVLVAPGPTAL